MRDRAWRRWRREVRYKKLFNHRNHLSRSYSFMFSGYGVHHEWHIRRKVSNTEYQEIIIEGELGYREWIIAGYKVRLPNPKKWRNLYDTSPRYCPLYKRKEALTHTEVKHLDKEIRYKKRIEDLYEY